MAMLPTRSRRSATAAAMSVAIAGAALVPGLALAQDPSPAPDFGPAASDEALSVPPAPRDAAVDFAEMASFVDRMQTSFFHVPA